MVTPTPREEWQCQYRGGLCREPRAVKDDGTLHHLCAEHRERANLNQRRSQERRRRLRSRLLEAATAANANSSGRPRAKKQSEPQVVYHVLMPEIATVSSPPEDPRDLGGRPLLPDSELFAPILNELGPYDEDPGLFDDLFQLIGTDVDMSMLSALIAHDPAPEL